MTNRELPSLEDVEALTDYCKMEGTEIGEAGLSIMNLLNFPDYLSDTLVNALVDEFDEMLRQFETTFEIVEEKETYTTTYRRLKPKND